MIVVDVNLLLYAHIEAFPQHATARAWWEELLNSDRDVAIPHVSIFGFLRIATNARVLNPPLTLSAAAETVRGWLDRPNVRVLVGGSEHVDRVLRLLEPIGTAANLTTDAQLAALAMENQAELCSNDADFARFSGLRWINPLK